MLKIHPLSATFVGALLILTLGLLGASPAIAVATSTNGTGADDSTSTTDGSLTVSWLPQNQPAEITPGQSASSHFWVTNTSDQPMEFTVDAATAVPGDNGHLEVVDGADPRFTSTTFAPSDATIEPNETIEINTTIQASSDLPPGTYLIPAVVQPINPPGAGNVQIQTAVVALTTFQLPGSIDVDLGASLTPVQSSGTLVRNLPLLGTIVVGTTGEAALEISSESSEGLFAYYEVFAQSTGLGNLGFDDAVEGTIDTVRGLPQLYFPGTAREHALTWQSMPLALTAATLSGSVSFNPDPTTVDTVPVEASFLVVSPWWLVAVLIVLLVAVLRSDTRIRTARKAALAQTGTDDSRARRRTSEVEPSAPRKAIAGTIVWAVAAILTAVLSDYLVLATLVAIGLVATAATVATRDARLLLAARITRGIDIGAGIAALISIVLVAMTMTREWNPAPAFSFGTVAIVWLITAWWLPLKPHAAAEEPTPDADHQDDATLNQTSSGW